MSYEIYHIDTHRRLSHININERRERHHKSTHLQIPRDKSNKQQSRYRPTPYCLQITMSSLSNPKAVWFLGAPVSKVIAITAVVTYIVAEMNKIHNALVFGKSNIINLIYRYIPFLIPLTLHISFNTRNQQIRQKYLTMLSSIEYSFAI